MARWRALRVPGNPHRKRGGSKASKPRYMVMSIPGRRDDGKDTWWFVFDSNCRKSVPDALLLGEQGRLKVAKLARALNVTARR